MPRPAALLLIAILLLGRPERWAVGAAAAVACGVVVMRREIPRVN